MCIGVDSSAAAKLAYCCPVSTYQVEPPQVLRVGLSEASNARKANCIGGSTKIPPAALLVHAARCSPVEDKYLCLSVLEQVHQRKIQALKCPTVLQDTGALSGYY